MANKKEPIVKEYKGTKEVITVLEHLCKGCEICVEYCAPKVLKMDGFVVVVDDVEKCTDCKLCELRCPDFAIFVNKIKNKDSE